MTVSVATLKDSAAEALIGLLPSAAPVSAVPAPDRTAAAARAAGAVTAAYVGSRSADLAVVLEGTGSLVAAAGTDTPLVSFKDVLRPALEAAAGVLGGGVLGEALIEDASALFADPETTVFELTSGGGTAGWFAIRVREYGTLNPTPVSGDSVVGKLGRINNVEMALTVEIGRTRMSVRDVLNLEPGGVVELDRSAGAPADVLLNGRLIAHGEVVVVDQDFAVRITKILDVAEGVN
ncbi:flagellar motor switch protein FliN [Arthrobacter zhaoguopingii]|uniref:flagellar motor switch protein FliN n=1 Tax=Arthrobacter zhaoguopingii TaxID=2681491 RepID=UPI00135B8731|nr:flagellar motor switch protein FliN [Arthrobacter zhaoguopingii]